MADIIAVDDLPDDIAQSAMVDTWVAGANARAVRVAPCLADSPTADQLAEAKLILVGAIIRWSQAGAGALQSQSAGPFSQTFDTRQRGTGFNLWPSEIGQLQDICKTTGQRAYGVDTVGSSGCHSPICSVYFGGACSCGADIACVPIFEDIP